MSSISEFSVTLGVSSYSSALVPALQYYCRQDVHCSYATASLSNDNCAKSAFRDMTHFSENQYFIAAGCNEIVLEDGSTLFGGTVCRDGGNSTCPAIFYRYSDGRDETASCPTGTEMVVSASGNAGDITYLFKPEPGAEILGDELPEGCSLVGGEYQCDPGVVTLRFTAAGQLACDVSSGEACLIPSFGEPYGECGGICETGPEIPSPPVSDDFSVELKVTSYSSSLTPMLEWSCVQDARCSMTAPPQHASTCSAARFDNLTHFTEHLGDLASNVCNEIVLKDGLGLYGATDCDRQNQCGGVLYRYTDGRDEVASCPSGTRMYLSVAGNVGDIAYILEPTTSAAELVGGLPENCDFISGGFRCEPGTVNFEFQHGAQPCDPQGEEDCPFPLLGYRYGSCGAEQCSTGPNIIPADPGQEFQVTLGVTSYSSSLTPALEWHCRHELPCSYVPDSLTQTCTTISNFATLTDFTEGLSGLAGGSTCNQIILDDASGVFDEVSCSASEVCGAVLFRYQDGRDERAVCPTGSELVISAMGNPGAIDYFFTPSEGVELMSELPQDCVFVAGAYRCAGGVVSMRFAHFLDPCDSAASGGRARCSTPVAGLAYGLCAHSNATCFESLPVGELPFTTFEPTRSPSSAPSLTGGEATPSPSTMPSTASPIATTIKADTSSPSERPSLLRIVTEETLIDTPVTVVISPDDLFGGSEVDAESVKVIDQPLNGNVTIHPDDGSFIYTPNPGFSGTDEFMASACDVEGVCMTLIMQVTVSGDGGGEEKKSKDALYALIALILAPCLWFFQEPLKRVYDRFFPPHDNQKLDGAATIGGATTGTGIPTSIGVDQTSFASNSINEVVPTDESGGDGESDDEDDEDSDDEDDDDLDDDDDDDDDSYSSSGEDDDERVPGDESDDTDEIFRDL